MARLHGGELIQRLQALVPALRERGSEAEEAGRVPQKTVDDLIGADVFRAVVPARFGGHEVDFRYVPQIFRTLSRGCVSTARTMGFLVYHNFQFAHFPAPAQDEVWGAGRGFTMAPGQVMPSGSATAAEGGYRLTGRWGYATGIHHGDWMLLSAPVSGGECDGDVPRFYVPVSEFRILDTWKVASMRATGSHDVELDDVFVPAWRSVRVSELRGGTAEGLALNPGYLWRIPLLSFMCSGAVGPMVGAAEAMLEIVTDTLRNKVRAYSINQAQGQMSTRVRLAQVSLRLQAMVALYERSIIGIEESAARGEVMDTAGRAEVRATMSWIASEAQAIVNTLAKEAGSRGNYLSSAVQRFQRDVNGLATHALFDMDHTGDLYAHTLLGMDLPAGAMV
jgi:3-hydroxy-9,10-secoandrosta-1,3,5(10)-triene-9,17-dione monooxygenase